MTNKDAYAQGLVHGYIIGLVAVFAIYYGVKVFL